MRQTLIFTTLFCLAIAGVACAQDEAAESGDAQLDTLAERAGYAIGINMGNGMKAQDVDVDIDALVRGLRDGLAGADGAMTDEEMQTTMQEFQQAMITKQQEAAEKAMTENTEAGDAYRADFGGQEGVNTLDSGVMYRIDEAGDGPVPAASDRVTVHYTGTLTDGEKFDSSQDRGQPATFPVTGVISGWQEVLQLMPVGSKWTVVIPPDQAYGERGSPPKIGPASTLVFEIELLGIEGQGDAAAPAAGDAEAGDPATGS